jgi:calcineurin-like phosphoesterase family protein
MATVAIGDVHGNLAALRDLVGQLDSEITHSDVVVFLGDYIDRGPDSRGCIDAVLDFRARCRGKVVCLRGNHEDWLLRTRRDYSRHSWLLGMNGLHTIHSYSPEAARTIREALAEAGLRPYLGRWELPYGAFFDALPPAHRVFFDKLELLFESEDCICSHAGLNPDVTALSEQDEEALVWGADGFPSRYRGERPIVYGHWRNPELTGQGWPTPRIIGNTVGIDTIEHGVLTAIRMPERQVFQSARYVTEESSST